MNSNIETIFKKHQVWIDIVSSFGCNRETAEDIVMEMYIKIDKSIKKGLDIDYNKTDYNYYYIFKTLKSLFLDLKRKEKKVNIINIDEIQNKSFDEIVNYTSSYSIIQKKLKKMYWYDRKIFEIIQGGESHIIRYIIHIKK